MLTLHDLLHLGASGGVGDIRLLLPLLPPRASELGRDAARAAGAILERASPEDVGWLERHRSVGSEYLSPHPSWDALRPDYLGAEAPAGSPHAAIVALASMHWSGYVRERAVHLLAERRDGGELPYLIVRLNDWVRPVREAAESAVRARLVPAYAAHFVRCLSLVDALRGERRAPHRALAESVDALLRTEAAAPTLEAGLCSGSRAVRRVCARIAARMGSPALLLIAATDGDPIVATTAARAITATFRGEALREVLPRLRVGPPRVRCLALSATCAELAGEAEPYLRRALLDEACSVREHARFLWAKAGLPALDFATFYREALPRAKGRAFAAALRGLAETGTEADAPLFEPHLGDRRASVRAAAVVGLGRCGMARYGDALIGAMHDPSSRVSAVARTWAGVRLGRAYARHAARAPITGSTS